MTGFTMKILMRGYADPHKSLSATQAISEHLIGLNSGNLIFTAAAKRNLMTEANDVTLHNFNGLYKRGDQIRENYDAIVFPLANAFRPEFVERLNKYTGLIKKAKLPVVVLGVGAQATLDYDFSQLKPIEDDVKAFVGAVLDHGPTIGVRGRCTEAYLNSLGFSDVQTIGCPSMFMYGGGLSVNTEPVSFNRKTKIALNLTPRVEKPENYVRDQFERFPQTTFIPQDTYDLLVMLGDRPITDPGDDYPGNLLHPALLHNKTVFFLHATTWIERMKDFDFAFGSRIHGNVAALLAGTPAHVIAHDSRTLELAEYFEIPHTRDVDLSVDSTADKLYESSDFGPMMANHGERFRRFTDFLDQHGIDHIHQHDVEPEFDRLLRSTTIGPEATVTVRSSDPVTLSERIWRTTRERERAVRQLELKVEKLKREVINLRSAQSRTLAARVKRKLRGQ